jgi:hypothetical protein
LTVEAVSRGLVAHPMAGFNSEAAHEVFGIPDGVRPIAVERDARGRDRLPLEEVVFVGTWGQPLLP